MSKQNMKYNRHLILFTWLLLVVESACAFFPINLFQPYDMNTYRQYHWKNTKIDSSLTGEFGLTTIGRDDIAVADDRSSPNQKVNVLKIWNNDQNSLAMLKGLASTTNLGSFSQVANLNDDDGVRGHISIKGDLDVLCNIPLAARVHLPHDFVIGVYLPIMSMNMDVTSISDLTQSLNNDDLLVKNILTNNFVANVKSLTGIKLSDWSRTGIGDLSVIGEWQRDFPQAKELLKNVRPRLKFGFTLPTGKTTDEDEIMSIPFGNDGALGIVFGGGLDLTIGYKLKVGFDVEFLNLFNDTRERRIKTDRNQTDLLFPVKVGALKEYGITERFNLYLEFFELIRGLTFRTTYQYWKHDDDELKVLGNQYSTTIANMAKSLEEWTMHNIIFNIQYDFQHDISYDSRFKPYLACFYKKGINGKNCISADTLGFTFGLSF